MAEKESIPNEKANAEKAPFSEGHDPHLDTLFKRGPVSPENFAWLPSRITLWWMNGMFQKGYSRQIEEDDLYEMLEENKAGVLAEQLSIKWEAEKVRALAKGKTPSLVWATIATFWGRYWTCILGMEFGGKYLFFWFLFLTHRG